MSAKKSFSISKGLASGLRSSVESASTNHGQQLHYDMMLIDVIEPDPNNPRKLLISRQEITQGLNKADPDYDHKAKELNDLSDLAESIKKVGIRNAIEVYKGDNKYRIISGERRYLAAILAGQSYVPARINQKFDEFKLRYIQWVENINRQDLSLWERYNNLVSMADAYYKTNSAPLNSQLLKKLLGVSDTQSYRYLCLLKADKEIIDLVKSGKLTNLKLIQELACIKNKINYQKTVQEIKNIPGVITSLKKFKSLLEKTAPARSVISLGKIKNINTAKHLLKIVLSDLTLNKYQHHFNGINWDSTKAINKAFKELLNILEKEFHNEETVDAN
ncbi:MAG: parB 4 [Gammaproteobacteria bacterium]|jgi:ParB family chromosome partitioning protein|nr:parB 4 [Gammaproteobacteria bacterium]